jgi:hypothetical protein
VANQTVNGVRWESAIGFDNTFKSCTVSFKSTIVGLSRNTVGTPFQFLNINIDSASCTFQEGNPFAN